MAKYAQSEVRFSKAPSEGRPNLYLIGFMGVGKSAIGRAVAKALRMQFIDSDAEIEERAGKPIADIFASEGEAGFRALERAFTESGHPGVNCVVSCGGGLPCQPGMSDLLMSKGVVVCLFASPQTLLERTQMSNKRPLLNVADPLERIKQLLSQREPVYMRTGIGVSAESRSLQDVVRNVIRVYRREAYRNFGSR
ncbi:MAG: shikimate kinase [Verrucomicrobia bacterium]|nr:shikimate kinase [Verrucomicrobiota bacterium]